MTTATLEPKTNGKKVRNGYALQSVPVDRLRPNPWNPNRMEPGEYAEYRTEVKHLGRLPKPCVARRAGDAFEIVDGEHGWRAASDLGFPTVDCEIIEADDFEAMRQTYKRNQHGTHNPVLQGRMFRTMRDKAGLSNRELAKQVEVSEGTIRNSILWADARDLRNRYAPETVDQDLEDLTIKQLRWYMQLPAPIRDYWLDHNADVDGLVKAGASSPDWDFIGTLQQYADAGLGNLFKDRSRTFQAAMKEAAEYLDWRNAMVDTLPNVDEFLRPLLERGLPLDFLDHAPWVLHEGKDPLVSIPISSDEWIATVNNCCNRAKSSEERDAMMKASIRLLLSQKGIDRTDLTDPRILEATKAVETAPDFIKNAEWLTIWQKWWLHTQHPNGLDEKRIASAKEAAVDAMKARFDFLTSDEAYAQNTDEAHAKLGQVYMLTINDAFERHVNLARMDQELEERDKFAADDEKLLTALVERWTKHYVVRMGTVDGRPAVDVLRERLAALPKPEFRLFACELLKDTIRHIDLPASDKWLEDVGGKRPQQPCE